jgi:hypothetical protein
MLKSFLVNLLVGVLSIWAIYSIISSAFGVFVVFPFNAVASEEVPIGRLHSIRLAVMATFAFYGTMHLFNRTKEVFPIHFLKTFLFFLGTMGLFFGLRKTFDGFDVPLTEWLVAIFWVLIAILLHIASSPEYRRYFAKK